MLSGDLHQRTLDALGDVPRTATVEGRDTLLEGIPKNVVRGLNRYNQRDIDLSKLITQLYDLGRLEESGARPLLIFLGNAQKTVDGTSPGRILKDIIQEIERLDEEDTSFLSLPTLSLPSVPEALIFGGTDERLSYEFFEKAVLVQKSVARLQVPRIFGSVSDGKSMVGTGWLVTPELLFTNYHVIDARRQNLGEKAASQTEFRAQALQTMVWFDYYTEGGLRTECRCIELISSDLTLDYALLRLEKTPFWEERTPLVIAQQSILIRADRLNIIQYPSGGPLRYAVRNNFYVGSDTTLHFIRYLTDTEGGSSGSPVFNDNWQVVAMHRAARPVPPENYKGETIKYHNEGIEIHPILNHLPSSVRQDIRVAQGW